MKFSFDSKQLSRLRVLAVAWITVQFLTSHSVTLASGMDDPSGIVQKARVAAVDRPDNFSANLVAPNQSVPDAALPSRQLHFSSPPTSAEISSARVFEEPLVPEGETSVQENLALAGALRQFCHDKTRAGLARLEAFLKDYSSSAWAGSVQAELGLWYRQHGYFTRAVTAWEASWAALKNSGDPVIHPLADRVAGELTELLSSLGRTERLQPLLQELRDRPIYGSATQQLQSAHEKLWLMFNKPGDSFKCGPYALDQIRIFQNPSEAHAPGIVQAQSSSRGFSLDQVEALALKLKMNYQIARRSPGAEIITPAVVHWKSGHYAALLKEDRGTYLVKDPTFGRTVNLAPDALEDEADGYFLVPNGTLPSGWRLVSSDEAKAVWGRGSTDQNDPNCTKQNDLRNPPDGSSCPGMMSVSVFLMTLSLSLHDTPLIYSPPVGPGISFQVIVNQLEANQPAIFSYSNLGPLAVHNWMAFVTAPTTVGQTAYINLRGGGRETYGLYTAAKTAPNYVGSYAPEPQSNATLWVTSAGTYERHLPDGSKEIYATPDGTGRVFLNQVVEPQGNAVTLTYDKTFRLVSLKDAIGQVTTLSYSLSADPLKITKVTDPFGRFASFGFTATAPYLLTSVTDEIGITSQISYGAGNQFASLVTPYGTTKFAQNLTNEQDLTIQVTDPEGQSEYYERRFDGVGVADSDPAIPSGYGLNIANTWLEWRDTYYWSKNTVAQYGTPTSNSLGNGYYNAARLWHWLHVQNNLNSCSGILESEKKPLESRVWYNYANQPAPNIAGPSANPLIIARLLDDGTTQAHQYSYNSIGQVTKSIDPIGRTLTNTYAANGIDLSQTQGANNALLATYTWNSQHRPLTYKDAAGQTTTYTWNTLGQLTSVKNAKSEVTTFTYYTANASGKQRLDRLAKIVGALPGGANTVTLDYDATGNVASVTGSDGYTLQFTYDALSRPLKVIYPDTTSTLTTYYLLDPSQQQDRLGRITKFVYNSLRQLTSVTDPASRTVQYTWCTCGHLTQIIDAMGRITTWQHDLEGRVIAKQYADGSQISYSYGPNSGRLISTTDEKGQIKTNTYNLDDTLAGITYTNAASATPNVSFTYDPAYLRMVTMTDGIGKTTYNYNAINGTIGAGQLSAIVGPWANDTVLYTYDALGRIVNRSISSVAEAITIDPAGRVTNVTSPLGGFTYGYDGATARLISVAQSGGVKSVFGYYPNQQDRRLQSITNYKADGTTPLSIFNYTSDAQGRILTWKQQQDTGATTAATSTLGYDNADQLISQVVTQGTGTLSTSAWQYDPAGNRTDAKVNGSETTASYNDLNQQVTNSAALPASTYEWDAENRLVAINLGTARSEFTYDGLGRRVKIVEKTNGALISTKTYVWDGLTIREQRDSTGANIQQRYYDQGFFGVTGSNLGTHLYTRDHLGSIREITDTSGTLQERINYDAWGNPSFSDSTPITSFAYTGFSLHPPSGLQLAIYRTYSAARGRWLSRDPLAEGSDETLYSYVNNGPVGRNDPFGLAGEGGGSGTVPSFTIYPGMPPGSQNFVAPNGQTFLAPAGTDFQAVLNAGQTNGTFGINAAVGHYGTFDFQRNRGNGFCSKGNIFYKAYKNASNYAVGVYMYGAGYSLDETLDIAAGYAWVSSSNAGSDAQKIWQILGWNAAQFGHPNGESPPSLTLGIPTP